MCEILKEGTTAMNSRGNLKSINVWIFLVPFLILSLVYSLLLYTRVNRKVENNYERFKENAVDRARIYSNILQKSVEAEKIINRLLDNKLISAGNTVMLIEKEFTNKIIKNLANSLQVDQISVFDKNGRITYSNIDSYVGWNAPENHPVYAFMKSGQEFAIEEIRADTISGLYYKYGYYRNPSGAFVQIGIMAKDIKNFLNSFDLKTIIEKLNKDGSIDEFSFIDKNLIVTASTKPEMVGKKLHDKETIMSVKNRKEASSISGKRDNVLYNSFIPLFHENEYVGTLLVSRKGKEAAYAVAEELKGSFFALMIGLLAISLIMLIIFRNSRNYMKLAYYDKKTGLPNQESLNYFLKNILNQDKKAGTIFLLNFSIVTNLSLSYGQDYAESVFTELVFKIKERFEESCIIFKISDERLVIYTDAIDIKEKQRQRFPELLEFFKGALFEKVNSYMPLEIGIVEFSDDDNDPEHILKKALIALNRVKKENYISYQYFNSEMESVIERENIIEQEILQAINAESEEIIRTVFQPQVDLTSGTICGFETLARMKSKTLGDIFPLEFIEIAERKRLITPLTELIFKKMSIFIKSLKEKSCEGIRVAINISGSDIIRSDFIDDISLLIQKTGIEYENLVFEITESVFWEDFKVINKQIGFLRDKGIQVSIDDFGTGYSSLSRLRELNISSIKIDKRFIDNILTDKKEILIIPDIISMAHKAGLKVIAEGVEEEAQVEYLAAFDCDAIQGYFYSKPLEFEDALAIVDKKFPV